MEKWAGMKESNVFKGRKVEVDKSEKEHGEDEERAEGTRFSRVSNAMLKALDFSL